MCFVVVALHQHAYSMGCFSDSPVASGRAHASHDRLCRSATSVSGSKQARLWLNSAGFCDYSFLNVLLSINLYQFQEFSHLDFDL
jgi:hypothetical protein